MRGYIEAAPEPGRADQFRLWLYGDCSQGGPRSILLTRRDVRGLYMFLRQLAKPPEVTREDRAVSRPPPGPQARRVEKLQSGPSRGR
jgi:hypothetical protein